LQEITCLHYGYFRQNSRRYLSSCCFAKISTKIGRYNLRAVQPSYWQNIHCVFAMRTLNSLSKATVWLKV